MGAPGRGADDRGRFRPGRRFAAVVARARLRLMAQSAAGGQDQGGDGAAPRPWRSVRRRGDQLARPPSGDRRPAGVRRRHDAHPRRFGRAPSTGAIARRIRSRRGRSRGLAPRARSRRHARMDAQLRGQDRLVQHSLRPRGRRARRRGRDRARGRNVRSGGAPGNCDGGQGNRRLDAPRPGGGRRRASNLRRCRGAHRRSARPASLATLPRSWRSRRIWSATRTIIRG